MTVFDGYSGSGTTIIASLEEKRNYICCEINKDYYKQAKQRFETYKQQLKLF